MTQARTILLLILGCTAMACIGQDSFADSLYNRYKDFSLSDSVRLQAMQRFAFHISNDQPDSAKRLMEAELPLVRKLQLKEIEADIITNLGNIAGIQGDPEKKRKLLDESLRLSREADYYEGIAGYYVNRGAAFQEAGKLDSGIMDFRKALDIRREYGIDDKPQEAVLMHNLGGCYMFVGDREQAFYYNHKALNLRKQLKDTMGMVYSYNSLGVLFSQGESAELDSGIYYLQRQLELAERTDAYFLAGYAELNLAGIYAELGESEKVVPALRASRAHFEKIGNPEMIAATWATEGMFFIEQEAFAEAARCCEQAIDSTLLVNKGQVVAIKFDCLYQAYKGMGEFDRALEYYEKLEEVKAEQGLVRSATELEDYESEMRALQDSTQAAMERQELVTEFDSTVARKNKLRNWLMGGGGLAILIAMLLYVRWKRTRRAKEVSEGILKNVLPEEITEEIRAKGKANAKHFDQATILFSDFKGFTAFSEKTSPEELVKELDICFEAFDRIAEKYNIEKIKTIGDSYMAAGGLPDPERGRPDEVVNAALEMQGFISNRQEELQAEGKPFFEMRIGIHTGPVVAGIVGVKKFQYDVWGDTVNTASRMESSGGVGKVNVSQSTWELIRDDARFSFEHRGKVEAKGKGELEMYFVELDSSAGTS